MPELDRVDIPATLLDRLLADVVRRHPRKSFGYLLAVPGAGEPSDYILFEENIRNDDAWRDEFESRGRYFVDHPDAGFVATPEESWRVHRELLARGLTEVAVFHTHRRHPGNFSRIDYDLHVSRFSQVWHMIISLRNLQLPQVRAFAVELAGTRELRVNRTPEALGGASVAAGPDPRHAAEVLRLDRCGLPVCRDLRQVHDAIVMLASRPDRDAYHEFVTEGFLAGAGERYATHVEPYLVGIRGGTFEMGTPRGAAEHFYGETPRHRVELSPFQLSSVQVTVELFGLLDPDRAHGRDGCRLPVVDVSWHAAAVFAMWVGCRLPTEAEWEFAAGAGSAGQWCCPEEDLPEYAWYSENAGGRAHQVAIRKPNSFGLHDLHGNVWEWCQDDYRADFYACSPARDPVAGGSGPQPRHKVSRGGGFLALAEMCRTRYRLHDPADFHAPDLGFRLARSLQEQTGD